MSATRMPTARGIAGTLLTAVAREGAITWVATYVREVCGHEVAKLLDDAPEHVKIAVSGAILGATALLNGLVFWKQRADGRANTWTKSGQLANAALILGAGGVAAGTGALGKAAPLLVKATTYSIIRDLSNLLVRVGDNRDPAKTAPNEKAVFADAVAYFINQYFVNTLQGSGVSHSGTSTAAASESVGAATRSLLAFSAANAGGEIVDAVSYPMFTAFFDKFDASPTVVKGMRDGMWEALSVELKASVHIPFVADAVNRLLNGQHVGKVSNEDLADKAMGAMLGRQSLFVTLFTLIDAIGRVGTAAKLDPQDAAHVTNLLAALTIGFMVPVFVGAASASPRTQPRGRDIEAGVADRQADAV
ncbi:hypothetical protein [Burkholderia cepacia]|uniref:hypothetical protein n=1 Tax=Burkholderia cepacia TaxID=292 RepID=UPI00398EEDEE